METIAKYPFKFYTRLTLPQLTGIYALNLKELLDGIKKADDSIIYYHTHHYLIQHHYVVPDAPNDFAHWIINTLGEKMLGEETSTTLIIGGGFFSIKPPIILESSAGKLL